jgi:hypothetical protein
MQALFVNMWIVFSISYKKNGVNLGLFKVVLKEDFAAVRNKTPLSRR